MVLTIYNFTFVDIPGLIFRDISYGIDKELKDATTGSFHQAGQFL